uniref:Prolyl 4 hydroxylase subunit alpha 1 n=1 Tax=Echinococcus granulosus TaxID=6210 RepID=A0A068WMK5_ECHGR|nr:prolyl 4 hydroxylase subunit alpha 1 [Echinococcus granulosus]
MLLLHLLSTTPFGCTTNSPDIVSALTNIDQAVAAGRNLASELTIYVSAEETRLSKLRCLIQRLESAAQIYSPPEQQSPTPSPSSLPTSSSASREVTPNPVSAFLTILQLASNWTSELHALFGLPTINNTDDESERIAEAPMAAFKEFNSNRGLFQRLKLYADMLPDDNDVHAKMVVTVECFVIFTMLFCTDWQCMQLGLFAYEFGDYACAVEWYRLVLDRLNQRKGSQDNTATSSITYDMVYDHISYALGRAGRYKEALEVTNKLLIEDPTSQNGALSKVFYEMELKRYNGDDPPHSDDESPRAEGSEAAIFDSLCRTADLLSPPDQHLSCHYFTPHSFFILGPLKGEVIQLEPPILQWHDFVTQNEVEQIIKLARPKLKRALVRNPTGGALEPVPYRVTKKCRFETDEHENAHGNRIATAMIYLTSVKMGGATAFTKTKAVVKPVARSLVFWYNLLRSGDGDMRSRHGACPVLVGCKWVMNKWIRAAGQEFSRPCLLQREPFNPQDEYNDS